TSVLRGPPLRYGTHHPRDLDDTGCASRSLGGAARPTLRERATWVATTGAARGPESIYVAGSTSPVTCSPWRAGSPGTPCSGEPPWRAPPSRRHSWPPGSAAPSRTSAGADDRGWPGRPCDRHRSAPP